MFREIRNKEVDEKKKELGYKKIKPEKDLSVKELMNLCTEEFMKASMEMTQVKGF